MKENIMFIWAHNDDAEIFCWWTLLYHNQLGYDIYLAHMDHKDQIRKDEQAEANIKSGFNSDYFSTTDELCKILLEKKPTIVISHRDEDRHPDHRLVSTETLQALKKLKISQGLPKRLYFCSTYDHLGIKWEFPPTDYIDISAYQEKKEELIRSFASQNPEHRIKKAKITSQLYGSRIWKDYAEALKEVFYLWAIQPIKNLLK